MSEARDFIQSFGRRTARTLTPHKKQLRDELLPTLLPKLPEDASAPKLALEIGFGGGEHLYNAAKSDPDTLYIGAEPFMDGVAKLLAMQDAEPLPNLRIWADDARLLMQQLPEGCLDYCYVLFPDPWPKTRHHKRRLIQHVFLDHLYRLLKPTGKLLLATDHRDYSVWMLEQMLTHKGFKWTAKSCDDWTQPPERWTQTRYQQKTTEQGREPVFLEFRRTHDMDGCLENA